MLNPEFTIRGKSLNWLTEIDSCVTFSNRGSIPITDLLKEVLLRNDIPLSYQNREKVKLALVQFVKTAETGVIGFSRTSEIFLTGEDKKYLPLYNGSWVSHIEIRKEVWEQFKNH